MGGFLPLNTGNSQSANYTQVNNLMTQFTNEQTTKIIKDTTGTRRVLIGGGANGFEGIKTSPPGVDVYTAADNQLSFNSDKSFTVNLQSSYTFPSFGVVAATTLNNGSYTTIPHNAGKIPSVLCFGTQFYPGVSYATAPAGFPLSSTTLLVSGSAIVQVAGGSGNAFFNFYYTVDTVNLYIGASFQNGTSSPVTALSLTIYYTIFTLGATTTT